MRTKVTAETLERFMRELSSRAQSAGAVYFTGGVTALLLGLREQTIDIDIKFDPEPRGAFEAIAQIKNSLDLNIELASPADFIPVTHDWKEKSLFIVKVGEVTFSHFDLRAQILSKIERGYAQDLDDARRFLLAGEIAPDQLWSYFMAIQPGLIRYPAIGAEQMEKKLKVFLQTL
jgi:hypothetical protein